jgi:hypothetical protein
MGNKQLHFIFCKIQITTWRRSAHELKVPVQIPQPTLFSNNDSYVKAVGPDEFGKKSPKMWPNPFFVKNMLTTYCGIAYSKI